MLSVLGSLSALLHSAQPRYDDGDGAAASYVDSQKGPVLYKLPGGREIWLGGSDAESSDDLPIERKRRKIAN